MKKSLIAAGVAALLTAPLSGALMATTLGVSVARFDDNGLTIMRNGMTAHVETLDGVDLQMEDAQDDVARQLEDLRAQGKSGGAKAYMLMGQLSNQAAVQRSKDFHDVIGMDMCNFITLIDEQTANWSRDEAQDLMTNWISSGEEFDAVFGNNDEMAIGAIQAMKASGISMDDVVVGGVDATPDALVAKQAGEMARSTPRSSLPTAKTWTRPSSSRSSW